MIKPKNKIWLCCLAFFMLLSNANAQTTQTKGLTIVIDFADQPFGVSVDSIDMLMNQTGFNGWGVIGSAKDYFYQQSNNKELITSEVVKVVLPHNFTHYHYYNPVNYHWDVLDVFYTSVINGLTIAKPAGFTNLTIRPDGSLAHLNFIYRGPENFGKGVAWGLGHMNLTVKNNNVDLPVNPFHIYGISKYSAVQNNTIIHEMGHSVMGWTDYYNTSEVDGSTNLGHYCVMGSGGDHYNPVPICAPLRYQKGWITTVTELPNVTATYTAISNSRSQVFKYTNPTNPHEYYMIEALYTNGYYLPIDGEGFTLDQGLAVWYVDEERGKYSPVTLPGAPKIKLLQADGLDEMHDITKNGNIFEQKRDLRGDMNDMFDNVYNTLSAATHPLFRWKDGSEPGLIITNISAPGATMQFTVQARPNTISSQLSYADGGTVSPSGLISYTNGTSKTFTIVPEIGYAVSNVITDGTSRGSITSHTFNTSGNHNISATFAISTTVDPLPTPWSEAQIGNTRKPGTAGYRSGTFGLESSSYDIWGEEDGLTFVYQPMSGNGEIVARITSMNNPTDWAKAGIMMRESLAANSKHFMLVKTPSNNYAPQLRATTGGGSIHKPQPDVDIQGDYNQYQWVKIVRQGSTFTSYVSLTGTSNWIQLATYNISMTSTIFVGMCAGAGSDAIGTKVKISNVTVTSSNVAPTVSITSPASGATFTAPANITFTANAADANGSVTKVEFFNGSTLLGTDMIAPYAFTWANVAVGSYTITAKATDNQGAVTTSAPVSITLGSSTADLTGPACGNNNTTLLYELAASKRTNATGYGWYYTGSSQGITPVSGSAFRANLTTGNNFGSGQVCVGVNYSTSPWYASYCKAVTNCSAREGEVESLGEHSDFSEAVAYQNPFVTETTISLADANQTADVKIFNASGVIVTEANMVGSLSFGSDQKSGMYIVKMIVDGQTKTFKLVKE